MKSGSPLLEMAAFLQCTDVFFIEKGSQKLRLHLRGTEIHSQPTTYAISLTRSELKVEQYPEHEIVKLCCIDFQCTLSPPVGMSTCKF